MEILKTNIVEAFLGKLGKLSFKVSSNGKNYCYKPKRLKRKSIVYKKQKRKWKNLYKLLGRKWRKLSIHEKESWKNHSTLYPWCSGYNIYIASAHKLLKDQGRRYLKKNTIEYPQEGLSLIRRKLEYTHRALQKRKTYKNNPQDIKTTYQHLEKLPIKLTNRLIVPKVSSYKELKEAFKLKLIQRKSYKKLRFKHRPLPHKKYNFFLLANKNNN